MNFVVQNTIFVIFFLPLLKLLNLGCPTFGGTRIEDEECLLEEKMNSGNDWHVVEDYNTIHNANVTDNKTIKLNVPPESNPPLVNAELLARRLHGGSEYTFHNPGFPFLLFVCPDPDFIIKEHTGGFLFNGDSSQLN